jgi:hypothetical protein
MKRNSAAATVKIWYIWDVIKGLCYHGTGKNATGSIAQDRYMLSKGTQFLFGRETYMYMYSTPYYVACISKLILICRKLNSHMSRKK